MKIFDCNNHVKSAIEFFGPSCAINSLLDKYNPMGNFFILLLFDVIWVFFIRYSIYNYKKKKLFKKWKGSFNSKSQT